MRFRNVKMTRAEVVLVLLTAVAVTVAAAAYNEGRGASRPEETK